MLAKSFDSIYFTPIWTHFHLNKCMTRRLVNLKTHEDDGIAAIPPSPTHVSVDKQHVLILSLPR